MSICFLNFFLIFSGKIEYKINSKILKERFHQLQKELHPDRNPTATEWSSHVNQCYQLLNNPLQRAIKMVFNFFLLNIFSMNY